MEVYPQTYESKKPMIKKFDAHSPHKELKVEMSKQGQIWATYVHQFLYKKGRPFEHKRTWLDESPNHHENG